MNSSIKTDNFCYQIEYYSIKDIITITGFSRSTIMRALKDKRLISTKVKGSRKIRITDFEKYMEGDE